MALTDFSALPGKWTPWHYSSGFILSKGHYTTVDLIFALGDGAFGLEGSYLVEIEYYKDGYQRLSTPVNGSSTIPITIGDSEADSASSIKVRVKSISWHQLHIVLNSLYDFSPQTAPGPLPPLPPLPDHESFEELKGLMSDSADASQPLPSESSLFDDASTIEVASSDPNVGFRLLAQKMARGAGRVGGAASSSLSAVKRFGGSMGRMLSRRAEPPITPEPTWSSSNAFSSSMGMLDIGTFDLYGTLERLRHEGGRQWKRGDSELDAAMKDVALDTAQLVLGQVFGPPNTRTGSPGFPKGGFMNESAEASSNLPIFPSGMSFAAHVAQTVTGNMMRAGFDELINRERTSVSSRESERSAQARNGLRLSRSQQAAALMMELQKAQRNM